MTSLSKKEIEFLEEWNTLRETIELYVQTHLTTFACQRIPTKIDVFTRKGTALNSSEANMGFLEMALSVDDTRFIWPFFF